MLKKFKKVFGKIKMNEVEMGARELSYLAFDVADWIMIAGIGILSSAIMGLVVFKVMAVGGLPAILAQLMASTCEPGVPCDFQSRMGAVGLALVVVTIFFITTIKMVNHKFVKFEYMDPEHEPCRFYNAKQVEFLRVIQSMGGIENLRKFANLVGTPYTTARNYVDQFERDGYVKVHSNGQGSRLEIELIQQ